MATIKRYHYIIDDNIKDINNKIYPILKIYKGNSSNQAELTYNNFEIEEVSTNIDFTKTTFTAAEVIAAIKCNAVSNFKVGDILTISNIYCSQWVVIGKDHDGTTGTIDIMSTTQVDTSVFASLDTAHYSSYGSFDNMNIILACKTMSFFVKGRGSDTVYYNQKAKIISCKELNYSSFEINGVMATDEGEAYSDYFPSESYSKDVAKRWVPKGSYGSTEYYWTRSRYLWSQDSTSYQWAINKNGNGSFYPKKNNSKSYGIVPIVRLGTIIHNE